MKRFLVAVTLVLVTGFLCGTPVHSQQVDSSPSDSRLLDFLREHVTYRDASVSFERDGNFYVEITDLRRDVPVEVYRKTVRETEQGKRLVEQFLGTAKLVVEGPELARLVPNEATADSLSLGDQVRTRPVRIDLVNRTERPTGELRSLILEHPGINEVRPAENPAKARLPYLLVDSSGVSLFFGNNDKPTATLTRAQDEPRNKSSDGSAGSLRGRTSFDRTVNDFEWIRLPTRSPIHLIALAGEGSVGFARFEDEVTGIHWLDVSGSVLDVSIRNVSTENPVKIYFLAVLKQNGFIRTRAYSYNALDRTLVEQWTANDRWVRKTADGRYYTQELGLNVPFSRTLLRTDVTSDGLNTNDDEELTFAETVISPGYASQSSIFAYLDGSGRLHLRGKNGVERTLTPEFGGDPRSVSARRNDRSRPLQPEFALNASGDSLYLFLPRNIVGGISFIRGLRSYKQSRLFLLNAAGSTVNTLWESNLQSGYVSAAEYFEGTYWAMLVNPSSGRSRLKEFRWNVDS